MIRRAHKQKPVDQKWKMPGRTRPQPWGRGEGKRRIHKAARRAAELAEAGPPEPAGREQDGSGGVVVRAGRGVRAAIMLCPMGDRSGWQFAEPGWHFGAQFAALKAP